MLQAIRKATLGILICLSFGSAFGTSGSCLLDDYGQIKIVESKGTTVPEGPQILVAAGCGLSVKLMAAHGASIDLDSVRVRYRVFDITHRIAEAVGTLSTDMLVAGNVLPPGNHRVSIQVKDDAGRRARLKLTLHVPDPSSCRKCDDVSLADELKVAGDTQAIS